MKWHKKGLIFSVKDNFAQIPTALVMEDKIRVYYASRDKQNRSHTYFFDVDIDDPTKVIGKSKKEVLPLGKVGAFDDDGVMPSWVFKTCGRIIMKYIGWNRGVTVPYRLQIGSAFSKDGGKTFKKDSEGPTVWGISHFDPYFVTTISEGYYASCVKWIKIKDKYEPIYRIKNYLGDFCIKINSATECTARPSVIKINYTYHMWYCFRDVKDYRGGKGSYRIGYASSKDGLKWKREDKKAGITLSKKGWDSEMIEYPCVVEAKEKIYMFYNGSGFGKTGIGLAELEV